MAISSLAKILELCSIIHSPPAHLFVLDELHDLFPNSCQKGTLPQDLRDAVIFFLSKNKGGIRLFNPPRHQSTLHCDRNRGLRVTE